MSDAVDPSSVATGHGRRGRHRQLDVVAVESVPAEARCAAVQVAQIAQAHPTSSVRRPPRWWWSPWCSGRPPSPSTPPPRGRGAPGLRPRRTDGWGMRIIDSPCGRRSPAPTGPDREGPTRLGIAAAPVAGLGRRPSSGGRRAPGVEEGGDGLAVGLALGGLHDLAHEEALSLPRPLSSPPRKSAHSSGLAAMTPSTMPSSAPVSMASKPRSAAMASGARRRTRPSRPAPSWPGWR